MDLIGHGSVRFDIPLKDKDRGGKWLPRLQPRAVCRELEGCGRLVRLSLTSSRHSVLTMATPGLLKHGPDGTPTPKSEHSPVCWGMLGMPGPALDTCHWAECQRPAWCLGTDCCHLHCSVASSDSLGGFYT